MYLTPVLKLMAEKQASDLFISAGMPMSIKILGTRKCSTPPLWTRSQTK